MNCYRVIFSTIKLERDEAGEVKVHGNRFSTPGAKHVLADSEVVAGAFIEEVELETNGVDEVHVQQVAEIAKNVLVASATFEVGAKAQLPAEHPQMSGLVPPEDQGEAPGV